jgi:uncharacterized protein YecE (DUF72 family)
VFNGTEINSSFHRPHRTSTYLRWGAGVPDAFRFSVKLPKAITHQQRLVNVDSALDAFLEQTAALGARLGCLLVQLPPSLQFVSADVEGFLAALRKRYAGDVALEPRHETWFSPTCADVLKRYQVAQVAADPAVVPEAAEPGGWGELVYFRLHGSPVIYRSSYSDTVLAVLVDRLRRAQRASHSVWCIFDNTASGAAVTDALALRTHIGDDWTRPERRRSTGWQV